MISDNELCEYIERNPGKRFVSLRIPAKLDTANGENERMLDRVLQRLRRSGRIHFKKGGWHPGKGYTVTP
jgi:hypothetical protein